MKKKDKTSLKMHNAGLHYGLCFFVCEGIIHIFNKPVTGQIYQSPMQKISYSVKCQNHTPRASRTGLEFRDTQCM